MKLFLCAGNNEIWSFAKPIGMGLVKSAINLSKILYLQNNLEIFDELVFVGTCGLYEKGKIFDIIQSQNACNLELAELLNLAYSPFVARETSAIINSSNVITTDKKAAQKFAKLGFIAENMEFYSVCEVARSFNLKVKGIFCATNFCNENAHKDFVKNHKKAMEILENFIKENYGKYIKF